MENKVRLFEGITCIDPVFVEEAALPLGQGCPRDIRLKKACALAAAFAFAVAVLFSVNAAFPAFAESLPLIGEVFKQLNSLGSNAPSYEGMIENVGESAENTQYKATVTEAYCDGEYVFFAMRLQPKDAKLLKMESLFTEESAGGSGAPGWNIAVNGDSGGITCDTPVFVRKGSCFESSPVRIALPEGLGSRAPILIEVAIGGLYGRTEEAIDNRDGVQAVSTEPLYLSFELAANTSYSRQGMVRGIETDGLELLEWSCSPSKLSVTIAYPYFQTSGVGARAYTGGGIDLGEDLRESGDFGDGRYSFGDTAIQECSFTGPPDGTSEVVFIFYKEQSGKQAAGASVFGEFTIDLETGSVTATEHYLDDGFEHLSIAEYAAASISRQ